MSDEFEMEKVPTEAMTFSPDGRSFAFIRIRPISTLPNPMLIEEGRGDLWLQEAPGQAPRNLTNGVQDQSGAWAPQWSPDGQRLAFLCSRNGEVRLWMWERDSNRLQPVSRHGVEFDSPSGLSPYRWIDNRRLLFLAYSEGEKALPLQHQITGIGGRGAQSAVAAWASAARGELTASSVDSLRFRYPERTLVLVDVVSGASRMIAKTYSSGSQNWWLAPQAKIVAAVTPQPVAYPSIPAFVLGDPAELALYRLDGNSVALSRSLPTNIATSSLRVSPDGKAMVFFAWGDAPIHPTLIYDEETAPDIKQNQDAPKENPAKLWRVDLAQGRVEMIDIGALDLGTTRGNLVPSIHWTAAGEWLIHNVRRPVGGAARPGTPPQWLVLSRNGSVRPLGAAGTELPSKLQSLDGGRTFVGLHAGEVWRIDPVSGSVTSLTDGMPAAVDRLQTIESTTENASALLLTTKRPKPKGWSTVLWDWSHKRAAAPASYHLLNPASGQLTVLDRPVDHAWLATYDLRTDTAVWFAEDRRGTFLWRKAKGKPGERLVATNSHLRHVLTGEERMIEYTTLNGERMQARVVLPPGYRKGRRYPVVVDFDIGITGDTSFSMGVRDQLSIPRTYDSSFSAAGYVYMYASWPTTSMDDIGRPNLLLGVNGIVPAIEKAIEIGIADPERLFLYGGSSAGYGVYALVTQTTRFKAAVASSGWVDQITQALSVDLGSRYTAGPFNLHRGNAYYMKRSYTVWRFGDILRRNSPLSYVDRVQTPLLMLHGDLDTIPISQPEMFFSALATQRKPARFVRYFGEGHGNKSPANLRDFFQQIFAWYDEWGDIARAPDGKMLWDGDHVRSRNGAAPMKVDEYLRLDVFSSSKTNDQAAR